MPVAAGKTSSYQGLIMNGITASYNISDGEPFGESLSFPEGTFCPFHLFSNNLIMPLMPMCMRR